MRRRSRKVALFLVPVLLAGCSDVEDAQQRDVYTKFEDCMADWGQQELCVQLGQADAAQFAEETTGVQGGGSGAHTILFWGPHYYPSDRSVIHNGRTITPSRNSAMSRPFHVTERSSASAKTSASKPSTVSRGGFGSTGRGLSAGG